MGRSLWLRVGKVEEDELARLIEGLASRETDGVFVPHITLVSLPEKQLTEVHDARLVETLAKSIARTSFSLALARPTTGEKRTECVLAPVLAPKGLPPALETLRRTSLEVLGMSGDAEGSSYFPHLSLVYGNLSMEQRSEKVRQAVEWCGADRSPIWRTVQGRAIEVWQCDGLPSTWRQIASCVLDGERQHGMQRW